MRPPSLNLQLRLQPWLFTVIDSLVGTSVGSTRAEVARYLMREGYRSQQAALDAERAKKETA